jgi:hypothetical protein
MPCGFFRGGGITARIGSIIQGKIERGEID